MKKKSVSMAVFVLAFVWWSVSVYGQMAKIAPFEVKKSTLIEQIKAIKTANPKISPAEFADAANALLDRSGVGFSMSFDTATCERLRKIKEQQKDPTVQLRLGATLKSVDAEGASLALPEPIFPAAECGGCYIELPLLQVTDKDFITVISGRNIKFHLPANFFVNEAVLLDSKDQTTIKAKWRIPFRTLPIGVSHDENVLYLQFDEAELSDLSLLVFGEGVFQIGTRADAEDGGKGKMLEAAVSNGPSLIDRKIRFDRWSNSYVVGYRNACPR